MNLRPVKAIDIENLLRRHQGAGSRALGKLVPLAPARIDVVSIWEMRLPNESYMAPHTAFWFVSTGLGR